MDLQHLIVVNDEKRPRKELDSITQPRRVGNQRQVFNFTPRGEL
jgi:hypothetical protein